MWAQNLLTLAPAPIQGGKRLGLIVTLFFIACGLVIAAALAAEAWSPKGVLIVSRWVWYGLVAALGVWLLVLAE